MLVAAARVAMVRSRALDGALRREKFELLVEAPIVNAHASTRSIAVVSSSEAFTRT